MRASGFTISAGTWKRRLRKSVIPGVSALPSHGTCAVASCPRQLPSAASVYCDAHVQRLRRKLDAHGDSGLSLEAVPGLGYRLTARV